MGVDQIDRVEDAMTDTRRIEVLLQDAIQLLDESGFPLAADELRDSLRGIRSAPTGAARRRRAFRLKDFSDGAGLVPDVYFCRATEAGPDGLRLSRSASLRRDEERYRRTLEEIQTILAVA